MAVARGAVEVVTEPTNVDWNVGAWDQTSVVGAGVELAPGLRVKQYELMRELGRGGMGVVFAARDVKLGRRVAIKFLRDATREVADRFKVEARATAQCSHENIVIIHEVDEYDGVPYMVLEYLEGQTLREVMGAFGAGQRLPSSRVVELILPVARALARAHELGIVHRDLKPENILVTDGGQIKVLDFGIAKRHGDGDHSTRRSTADLGQDLSLTADGNLVGTLPYMAPEQMSGGQLDGRTDLWALGVMMFEMLAGRHPVEPLTAEALYTNLIEDTPLPPIATFAGDIPGPLAQLVDACLAKPVAYRVAQAGVIVQTLENLLPRHTGRLLGDGESPYPGLTAFQESDANRFFGRERDVARVVTRLRETPLVGIVGPSGVGKSSFVRAGVGPALKASGELWEVITLRPGRHPLAALASIIHRLTRTGPIAVPELGQHDELVERLRHEPGYLGTLLRNRARTSNAHILVFIDQFEELYTLVPDIAERRAVTAALAGIADDPSGPLRVVVSMRSDFLDRIAEDRQFLDDLTRGLVFLAPPDRDGLREALVQPIEMVGYQFESAAMVGDMLDALASTPGALPLLQFAAAKLWDARDRQRRLLTTASYSAIGGISGALATHADEVVARMSPIAARLAQQIFRTLVTPDRTRAIVELSDLHALATDRDEIGRVIDQLVSARLLVVQTRGDAGGGSVEIVHESLIDRWPTLRRWLDEDQEDSAYLAQLSATAKQWDQRGRPAGLLWRGSALEEARRWRAHKPRQLAPRDDAFLQAAFALARRGKRMLAFSLGVAFTTITTIAVIASVFYFRADADSRRAAEKSRDAEEQRQRAEKASADAIDALDKYRAAANAERQAKAGQVTALQEKQAAENKANQTAGQLTATEQALMEKAAALEKTVAQVKEEKAKAERERATALAATTKAEQLNAQLKEALADSEKRRKALEDEKKKLTTKLK